MTRRTTSSLAMVGAFALLCIGGLGFLAVSMGLDVPGVRQGWRLEASFASVQGLVAQSDVDVSGVRAGRVTSIVPDAQGGALVTMVIDGPVRLRQDTRALLRPKTLIGEKFVELVRRTGSTAPYASDGYTLPRAQTGQAVEIDSVLNALDPQTRAALSQSLRELGVAVDGRQDDVNAAIPQVEQAAANLRPIAQLADARQQQIDRILTDLAVILAALADEQDALGRVIVSGDTATGALAQRDQQLAGTIQQADRLFASLDQVLAGTTPANRAALAQAPGTIASGRQLLSMLNPAVDRLLPELLLAQVAYPNNQLSVSHPQAISLAYEWISAFAQRDSQGHAFRVTPIVDPATALRLPALPTALPAVPAVTAPTAASAAPAAAAAGTAAQGAAGGDGLLGIPSAVQVLLGMPKR
jgi:phospholipid/cholesterol/gamma-HCH transport system substrate-binding protein